MSLFVNPRQFQNDEKGRASSLASYDFYESGTFDRKDTYSDLARTSINPNPVIADDAGRFPKIYLDSDESYRVVFSERIAPNQYKNVWTEDGVTGGLDASDAISSIDSVESLDGLIGSVDDQQISMLGWHPDSDVGGGTLYWNATGDRTDHNGGTIFSPTVPWTTTTADYLNAVGETAGATAGTWVRSGYEVISLTMFGAKESADNNVSFNAAQAVSESKNIALILDIKDLLFSGRILFDAWVDWRGLGVDKTILFPIDLTRTLIGGDAWIAKRLNTTDVDQFHVSGFSFDAQYTSGGNPVLESLISIIRIDANGSNDKNIRLELVKMIDPAHEGFVGSVATTAVGVSSGGTISNATMDSCVGDVTSLSGASRSANLFKFIHGSIDQPGGYGEYPISNLTSTNNECRGWRTLSDFKRGCSNFYHNDNLVIDMTDVASISVDGVLNGTIGPANTGHQTSSAVQTKNFYEIQGINVEVIGGQFDADNEANAVAAVLVTDYAYPAEITGSYTANQSININIRGFTAENITGHAVRLINTKQCSVSGINASNCDLDAVSVEWLAGAIDKNGDAFTTKGNSVDNIRTELCRFAVSANSPNNKPHVGLDLSNENGQYEVEIIGNMIFDDTVNNINSNELLEDFTGGVAPLYWSGAAAYTTPGAGIVGAANTFTLDDVSAAALQFKTYSQNITCIENDIFYFSILCKTGTGPSQSILVQEYTSADVFIASTFIPLVAAADWESRLKQFKSANATTAYINVSLLPAGQSAADVANVGTTDFAKFQIGKKPFNGI